jgi:hypothetical protein
MGAALAGSSILRKSQLNEKGRFFPNDYETKEHSLIQPLFAFLYYYRIMCQELFASLYDNALGLQS